MNNYFNALALLGLQDQNLPVFKEARYRRLASIEKMDKLITILPRLAPKLPQQLLILNPNDPEWDEKMIYPVVHYADLSMKALSWGMLTMFYCYNWNVLHANRRLRHLKNLYPIISLFMLSRIYGKYTKEVNKVLLFEDYCRIRAGEIFKSHKFLLDHEHFKRFVYFNEDLEETLESVHRQANNHEAADFKDSELILQDFIRRYSDPKNPDSGLFYEDGRLKLYN